MMSANYNTTFQWPQASLSPSHNHPQPIYNPITQTNPFSRKRQRSPSSSPEPKTSTTTSSIPSRFSVSPPGSTRHLDEGSASSPELDGVAVGTEPPRKRIRAGKGRGGIGMEPESTRRGLQGMGLQDIPMDGSSINPTGSHSNSYPHLFGSDRIICEEGNGDGDLPIYDSSIPILQPVAVTSPEKELGPVFDQGEGVDVSEMSGTGEDDESMDMSKPDTGNGQYGRKETKIYKGKEKAGYGWFEPEKDRIIITSLSDTESSPPSSPPFGTPHSIPSAIDLSDPTLSSDSIIDIPAASSSSSSSTGKLAQPGSKGFTISPSLMSRINEWQSTHPEQIFAENMKRRAKERDKRGLIVYRHPPGFFQARIPKRGRGMESDVDEDDEDDDRENKKNGRVDLGLGARIEEIGDDDLEPSKVSDGDVEMVGMDMDMDTDMNGDGDGTPGLEKVIESMDIE